MRHIALALLLSACGGTIGSVDSGIPQGGQGGQGSLNDLSDQGGQGGSVVWVIVDPPPTSIYLLDQLTSLSTYIDESCAPTYRDLIYRCDIIASSGDITETLADGCALLTDLFFELRAAQTTMHSITAKTSNETLQSLVDKIDTDINDFNIQVLNVGANLNGN